MQRQAVELIRLCLPAAALLLAFPEQSAAFNPDEGHATRVSLPSSTLTDSNQSGDDLQLEVELSDSDKPIFETHSTRKALAVGIFTVIFLAMLMLGPLLLLFRRNARKLEELARYTETIAYGPTGNRGPSTRYNEPAKRTFKALAAIDAERTLVARKLERAEHQADRLSEELAATTTKANARLKLIQELTQELRTPLTGAADLLQHMKIQTLKPERDRNIEQIEKSIKTLFRHIDVASLQAHLDGEGLQVSKAPFHLPALLQSIIDEFDSKVISQGVSLLIENECQHELIGDREQLLKMLLNLIDCLMKYSGRKHTILKCEPVSSASEGTVDLRFTLREAGDSIGPERTYLLFNPMGGATRKDSSLRSAQLTLTLCQRLAQSMEGSLVFETSMTGDRSIIMKLPFEIVAEPSR